MSGLPRDILKWMQSLDLSYSVKNIKRDFSNGFLIAEIFSRYYKQDVQMHSFDNGTSLKKRANNWSLLIKFFNKKSFKIEKTAIDAVIHCQEGAAVPLISQIYTILTSKTVPEASNKAADEYAPPFSRPTANTLVQNRMRDPDILTRPDQTMMQSEAQNVVDVHNESLRAERTIEPERFVPQKSQNTINRVATRKVGPSDRAAPQIQFKKAEVKQTDDNVAQLRATQSQRATAANQSMGQSLGGRNSSLGGGASSQAGRGVVKPSIELLNTCVMSKLEGMDVLKRFDPRKDAMICFVDDLATFPDDIACMIFDDAAAKVSNLISENCLASPKEFWKFFSVCWTSVTKLRPSSRAFESVVLLLEKVGGQMVEKDQYVPASLLADFGMAKIIDMLKTDPHRPQIIRILYAFSVNDVEEHVSVIRKLRDGLDNFETFVVCLSALIRLETQFTPKLLDLYLYYIVAGLRHASPTIRATCVSMLGSVAEAREVQGHRHVVNLFDRLEELSRTDTSWRVKSAVLSTSASLLSVLPPKEPLSARVYDLIGELAGPDASALILQTAVISLSQCVGTHPKMCEFFMTLVKDQPDVVSRALGYGDENLSVSTTQVPINDVMDRRAVAVAIAEEVKTTKPDNLAPAHVRLLKKSVEGLVEFPADEVHDWVDVYQTVRDHLVVELFEPSTCADACAILSCFLLDNQTQQVAAQLVSTDKEGEVPPLFGMLKLVYPDGDPACKAAVAGFLDNLAAKTQSPFPSLVYNLLMNFSKSEPGKFAGSELELIIEKLV